MKHLAVLLIIGFIIGSLGCAGIGEKSEPTFKLRLISDPVTTPSALGAKEAPYMTSVQTTVVESDLPDIRVGSVLKLTVVYNTNPYPDGFKASLLDQLSKGCEVVITGGEITNESITIKLNSNPGWEARFRLS